ncbi:MAG: hypothetical protein JST92_23575 [Deltaproteobacteria bacterium]|nr:hypothetical protein [Deltaproteobacteria bacterium]
MPEQTIEVEVIDPTKPAPNNKTRIRVVVDPGQQKATLTADGDSKELTGVRKHQPANPPNPPGDKPRVTGRYHPGWGADDRNITIIVDCDSKPCTIEVIVTYAEGSDAGTRDTAHCQKYNISPEECARLKQFIHDLNVPQMASAGPRVSDGGYADAWMGGALAAIGSQLGHAGAAMLTSNTEWLELDPRTLALVPTLGGVSITVTREGSHMQLVARASAAAVEALARLPAQSTTFRFITEYDGTDDLLLVIAGSGGALRVPKVTPPPSRVEVKNNEIHIYWSPLLPKGTEVEVQVESPFSIEVDSHRWSILI